VLDKLICADCYRPADSFKIFLIGVWSWPWLFGLVAVVVWLSVMLKLWSQHVGESWGLVFLQDTRHFLWFSFVGVGASLLLVWCACGIFMIR